MKTYNIKISRESVFIMYIGFTITLLLSVFTVISVLRSFPSGTLTQFYQNVALLEYVCLCLLITLAGGLLTEIAVRDHRQKSGK